MEKGKYHDQLVFLERLFEGLQDRLAESPRPGASDHAKAMARCLSHIRREHKALETIPSADWDERFRRLEVRLADCFGEVAEGPGTVP